MDAGGCLFSPRLFRASSLFTPWAAPLLAPPDFLPACSSASASEQVKVFWFFFQKRTSFSDFLPEFDDSCFGLI
jgi:hypothetical protein